MRTASSVSASAPISPGVTERMSPMRYWLYFVKLPPPKVAAKIPRATALLEKTPIMVSAAWLERLRTQEKSREKATLNNTAAQVGEARPQMAPMAMPVNAECPRASEKKLILPVTIMVERSPKRGAMHSSASRAFFIKSQWSISKGSASQKAYQRLIPCLLSCGRTDKIPGCSARSGGRPWLSAPGR